MASPATPRTPCWCRSRFTSLNEGRGGQPSATHPRTRTTTPSSSSTLEGRGWNPRRHTKAKSSKPVSHIAQRRSGVELRRHDHVAEGRERQLHRSTKATDRSPWRHVEMTPHAPIAKDRSTKAGGRTPETLEHGLGNLRQLVDHSTKAEVFEPLRRAASVRQVHGFGLRSTKARGRAPATLLIPAQHVPLITRSTKAEGKSRRHPLHHVVVVGWIHRSTKAEVQTPATPQRHLRARERALRSTKAEVRTPATPTDAEGGYIVPEDAQPRPGAKPRRHTFS